MSREPSTFRELKFFLGCHQISDGNMDACGIMCKFEYISVLVQCAPRVKKEARAWELGVSKTQRKWYLVV